MNDISLVPWDIMQIDNLISAWEVWKQSFLAVANLHAPVKKRSIRNSEASWLTPEIKLLLWVRDRTKSIATVTSDQLRWAEYRRLRNRVNHSLKASKKNYYHSYFEDNVGKAKATWNGINTLLSRKKNSVKLLKYLLKCSRCPEEAKRDLSPEYPCHNLQVIDSSAFRLLQRCLGLYR